MRVNAARAGTCRWHVSTQQFTRGEISEQKPDQEGMMNAGDASLQASAPIIEDGEPADVKKQSLPPQLYHMNQANSSRIFAFLASLCRTIPPPLFPGSAI